MRRFCNLFPLITFQYSLFAIYCRIFSKVFLGLLHTAMLWVVKFEHYFKESFLVNSIQYDMQSDRAVRTIGESCFLLFNMTQNP